MGCLAPRRVWFYLLYPCSNHPRNSFNCFFLYFERKEIYCYELYKFFGVENIIRIGSCGGFTEDLNILDVVLVDNTYTEGNFALTLNNENAHVAEADRNLNKKIMEEIAVYED